MTTKKESVLTFSYNRDKAVLAELEAIEQSIDKKLNATQQSATSPSSETYGHSLMMIVVYSAKRQHISQAVRGLTGKEAKNQCN